MGLKKYLPFEDYVLTTRLPVEEVCKRIAENIEPKKSFRFSIFSRSPTKPYEGQISNDIFTISRIIRYRNSFLPVITGHISTSFGQTVIKIKMRLMTLVLIFMSFWLGVVGLVSLGIILGGLFRFRQTLQEGFSPMMLIPFGMFIFGYLLTTLSFKVESSNAKKFLAGLLEGEEQNKNQGLLTDEKASYKILGR